MKKRIAILGSTGSIGTQALEVIEQNPDSFDVEVLTASENVELLIRQSIRHVPNAVVIRNKDHYGALKEALSSLPIKVFAGEDAISQVVGFECVDLVLTAMVGFSGLRPTLSAIEAGKDIALANKETLVVAGELIIEHALQRQSQIIPIDSEHSAIFQCLIGEDPKSLEKIILTASGGPFRGRAAALLKNVTPEEALDHPNWNMGPKITIDSATLMNKGLEVIEARWLFGLNPDQIEVIIHPQSIIHSMVQFVDGSIKAQMGIPDMKLPIHYALCYPERKPAFFERFSFTDYPNLTFEKPDIKIFRNLAISFDVLKKGGNWPCIMNAANEIAVDAFLKTRISFLDIPDIIMGTLEKSTFIEKPLLDDYVESDRMARRISRELIK
ncbi:MAG: 1-deoxy-D-xylulose-5-phosphate reductoisomerase [Bacteroidales bacterium]|nr:1-deoxy-D-xylulose-5-phosphate reductoisomerase [Bacteroidales bacterium]